MLFLLEFVYLLSIGSPRHTESSSWSPLLTSLCLPQCFLSLIFTSLERFSWWLRLKAQKVYSKFCVCHLGGIYLVLLPKSSIFHQTQDLAEYHKLKCRAHLCCALSPSPFQGEAFHLLDKRVRGWDIIPKEETLRFIIVNIWNATYPQSTPHLYTYYHHPHC